MKKDGGSMPTILFSCGRLLVRWGHGKGKWFRLQKHCPSGFQPLKYEVTSYLVSRFIIQWITRIPVTDRYYNISTDEWEGTWDWRSTSWKDTEIYVKPEPPRVPLAPR